MLHLFEVPAILHYSKWTLWVSIWQGQIGTKKELQWRICAAISRDKNGPTAAEATLKQMVHSWMAYRNATIIRWIRGYSSPYTATGQPLIITHFVLPRDNSGPQMRWTSTVYTCYTKSILNYSSACLCGWQPVLVRMWVQSYCARAAGEQAQSGQRHGGRAVPIPLTGLRSTLKWRTMWTLGLVWKTEPRHK